MNLRINTIRTGVVAATVAALSSCVNGEIAENAKQNAIPYLTAKELIEAEKTERSVVDGASEPNAARVIAYWDSILAEYKIKDAYYDGKKFAIDAYNGLNPEKKEYSLPLSKPMFEVDANRHIPLKENLKNQVVEYISAKEFDDLRKNEPATLVSDLFSSDYYNETKFWNDIRNTFRQREAFDKGMKDANDSLKLRKLPDLEGVVVSK